MNNAERFVVTGMRYGCHNPETPAHRYWKGSSVTAASRVEDGTVFVDLYDQVIETSVAALPADAGSPYEGELDPAKRIATVDLGPVEDFAARLDRGERFLFRVETDEWRLSMATPNVAERERYFPGLGSTR